ncbi:MAG: hypothetical protein AB7K68_11270 [Bacteriovoracia bacterium]
MRYLLFFGFVSSAFAADIVPQEAYFLLVGANDKQFEACPSPVILKKDSLQTGAFLQNTYSGQKITVQKAAGNRHEFTVGSRSVTLTVISPTEIHWDERGLDKDFKGKLCRKAIYTTNSSTQEEIDSMVKEDETIPAGTEPVKKVPAKSKKK